MKILLHTVAYRLWQVGQQLGFVAPLTVEEREEVARWLPSSALPLFQSMSAADQRHSLRVCRGLQARGCQDEDMLAAALLHDVGKAGGRVPFWTRPVIVLGKMCTPRLLARVAIDPRISRPGTFRKGTGECASDRGRPQGSRPHTHVHPRPYNDTMLPADLDRYRSKSAGKRPIGQSLWRSLWVGVSRSPSLLRSIVRRWRLALGYAWWHAEIGAELAAEAGLSERAVLYIRTHHQPHGPAAELHIVDEAS